GGRGLETAGDGLQARVVRELRGHLAVHLRRADAPALLLTEVPGEDQVLRTEVRPAGVVAGGLVAFGVQKGFLVVLRRVGVLELRLQVERGDDLVRMRLRAVDRVSDAFAD